MTASVIWEPLAQWLATEMGYAIGPERYYLLDAHCKSLLDSNRVQQPVELVSLARSNPTVRQQVFDAVAINESYFFRDERLWDDLPQRILPELRDTVKQRGTLSVLMCACSHGQEIYTLQMVCQEQTQALGSVGLEITAVDIDTGALAAARGGTYNDVEIGRGLSPARRDRWFQRKSNVWQVKPELQRNLLFLQLNLQSAFTFPRRFDLVFCRNVLIYFTPADRKRIVERLGTYLNGYGYLVLGGAETLIGISEAFQARRIGSTTLYQKRMAV